MSDSQQSLIQQSLSKYAQDKRFLDIFYELLFAKSGTAQESFEGIDMEAQKRKLGVALPKFLALAAEDPQSETVREAQTRHAQHHSGQRKLDYGTWIETLCQTCRQYDPQFTDLMESELKERLQTAVSHLKRSTHN